MSIVLHLYIVVGVIFAAFCVFHASGVRCT